MPPDPPSGAKPASPVVLRIKLRYDDVDAMVSRFAPNVGKSGLFLPTKSLQPVGAEVKFELRLANDTPVLLGLGKVKVTKPPDPANPKASFGMAIELMRVTRESRDLILRMLERRKQLGLPEVALPLPSDLDAARRGDVDTAVRDPASAPIPAVSAHVESQPSEALLTAPRRPSGPVAVAKVVVVEPLAPEPARPKRRGLAEVIEAASGPIAAVHVPGLDEDVDVAAVLARARALATGDLDSELEALRESQAAPVEIGVEAASAELARQLGGVAVRRDARGQSAPTGWAPPPAVADAADKVQKLELPVEPVVEEPVVAKQAAPVEPVVEDPVVEKQSEPGASVAASAPEPIVAKPELAPVAAEPPESIVAKEPEPVVAKELVDEPEDDEDDERRHAARTRIVSRDELSAAAAGFDAPSERFTAKPGVTSALFGKAEPAIIAPEPIDTLADEDAAAAALDQYEVATPVSPQAALTEVDADDEEEHEVQPDQIHDEIHQLVDTDYEEVEHTTIGVMPQPTAFDEHQFSTTPSMQRELADKLDEHLAAVEAEGELDDLGIGEASGSYQRSRVGLPQAEIYDGEDAPADEPEPEQEQLEAAAALTKTLPPEYQQDFIHRFDDDDRAGYAEEPVAQQDHDPGATIDAFGQTMDASLLAPQEDEVQEIDDFEILAEADEEDADLLSSSGEADASGSEQALPPGELPADDGEFSIPPSNPDEFGLPPANSGGFSIPPASASDFAMPASRESDFAMRLDLGDDEPEPAPQPQQRPPSHGAVPRPMDLDASAGHALAGFQDDLDEQSQSFTYAEPPQPPETLDYEAARGFSAPGRFDQSDVLPIAGDRRQRPASRQMAPDDSNDALATPPYNEPYLLRGPPPNQNWDDEGSSKNRWQSKSPVAPPPSDEIDLESALEALDVDLDDLSAPHQPTELARESRPSGQRAAIRPPSSAQVPETEPKRKSTRIPRGRAPRASTEDGVLIDFDDEEER